MPAQPTVASELATSRFVDLVRIAAGASGEVFRARDTADGTLVALKVATDLPARAALAHEALLASLAPCPLLPELRGLGHLSLAGATANPVEDGERDEHRAYLALSWVDGEPAQPGPPEAALQIAADIGDALCQLHALGFAHGDVKRQNVIVDPEGRARLIDLGLATSAQARAFSGGTPRMLATGDADLGDARSRDLLALGALLAELCLPELADAPDLIAKARAATLPHAIRAICDALLVPAPGARPSARWVASSARRLLGQRESSDSDRDARLVRAAYLKLRLHELDAPNRVTDAAAPWMHEAMRVANRARDLAPDEQRVPDEQRAPIHLTDEPIGRLSPRRLARWLVALCGPAASTWPLAGWCELPEAVLAERLTSLARAKSPELWTVVDFESARTGDMPGRRRTVPRDMTAERAAQLALEIAQVPPSPSAIHEIEHRVDAPIALVVASADALRRCGELGRARSLILREALSTDPQAGALRAEIFRRIGDIPRARASAERTLSQLETRALEETHDSLAAGDASARATAVLARLELDAGRVEEAERLSASCSSAATHEVAALAAHARADRPSALEHAGSAEALARTPEEQARALAVRGYVHHATLPEDALLAYAAAAQHAARAGAVVEEASYRTGEAACAVDVGELATAIASSRRAALLWEHLGRPAMATRAQLATAAAYATAGAEHEALSAAREAAESARAAGDRQAEAYAHWAIADVLPPRDARAAQAARHAERLLRDGATDEDRMRGAARILLHCSLGSDEMEALDRAAGGSESLCTSARLEWWGARAHAEMRQRSAPDDGLPKGRGELVLSALTALCSARAPLHARGPALAAGHELAMQLGHGEVARRLLSALGEAARDLTRRAPPELVDSVRALSWVARAASERDPGLGAEQVRDLEQLIRSLGEREKLGTLLNRIVDALVLWTGVERGLLLLRAPNGKLVPRAARNLARADLTGEQLALSQTLAKRALEAREPVVAVDAAGELPSVHRSVHSLKLRSVLAVPLVARGDALGVVYLDDRVRRGAFGAKELAWTRTIGTLAAMLIADARDQALLRRAARRAARASAQLTEALAHREAKLEVALRELAETKTSRGTRFAYDKIVGESEAIRNMLKTVDRVAASDVPVLVIGESGSGKELVARAIHDNGPRQNKSFVSENCGAIPDGLLESALFGHVRGAFTGADRPRAGLFDVADQGTLFLDEIGEMSLPMQAKLLRVLEDGVLRPLGTTRTRKVDVRVIAATHRDLMEMVRQKTFREDLLYRLNIITVDIPALRDRPEDVPLLVQHLLEKHGVNKRTAGATETPPLPRITRAAMDRLVAHRWPGNVRELENQVRRALVLCDGTIDREHLTAEIANLTPVTSSDDALNVRNRVDALEVMLVREALEKTGGNQTRAAKLLGLSRFGLQKMIKRLSI